VRWRALFKFLKKQSPFKTHSCNTPFRTIDFDGQDIIFRFHVCDFAFQVFAFRAVAGFFGSCVWSMMASRFLLLDLKGRRIQREMDELAMELPF
jgi:hypothetical protein